MIKPARHVHGGHFRVFALGISRQLITFSIEIGAFRIGLRTDRNIFPCSHGHGAGYKSRYTGDYDVPRTRSSRRHAQDETCRGDNTIVRAQYRCAEPTGAMDSVRFTVSHNAILSMIRTCNIHEGHSPDDWMPVSRRVPRICIMPAFI